MSTFVGRPSSTSTPTPTPTTPTPSTASGAATSPTGGAGLSTKTSTSAATGSGGGSTNARVPATFKIGPGDVLSPPVVSSPAFIAVQVSVTAGDGKAHTVVIETPAPHTLHVAAGRTATVLIGGLKAGTYRIEVDGTSRGALSIGGEPGP